MHQGQSSIKLDMRFGWRPDWDQKSEKKGKDAIVIKLTYPDIKNILRTSVRGSQLFAETIGRTRDKTKMQNQESKSQHQNALSNADYCSNIVYRGYKPKVSLDLHMKFQQKVGFSQESKFYDVNLPKEIRA